MGWGGGGGSFSSTVCNAALHRTAPYRSAPLPPEAWFQTALRRKLWWQAGTSITGLQEGDINKLYEFRHDLVPEAFQKYYDEAYDRNDTVIDRGGCKGLEVRPEADEVQFDDFFKLPHQDE